IAAVPLKSSGRVIGTLLVASRNLRNFSSEATRAIPVVMLTGIGHELNRKLAQEMGADGYITKPFDLQDLLDTVKQYELAICPVGA
ncbi:unnamed protein product, partial [marine sediment metagenome]